VLPSRAVTSLLTVERAISGSQSGATEHSNRLHCDAVSIGKYLTDIWKDRSAFMPVAKQNIKALTLLRNVGICLQIGTTSLCSLPVW
jgi:hypothetical protein